MSVTPNPNDGEPTVVMPAQAVGNASLSEITGWREASKRARRRRLALYAAVGTVLIAGMGSGWLFFARTERRLNASGPTSREVARPEVTDEKALDHFMVARKRRVVCGAARCATGNGGTITAVRRGS